MPRLVTPLVFAFAAALVAAAAMLVFGDPAKESRDFLALLVLAPAFSAAVFSALVSGGAGAGYRMGFARGALVGLGSLLVFSSTMAVLGCPAGSWFDCLLKSLVIFGFVMGVPAVVLSALVGMLLEELYCA